MRTHRWGQVLVLFCVLFLCVRPQLAAADTSGVPTTMTQTATQQLDSLPTQSIDQFWRSLEQQYGGYLPDASGESLVKAIFEHGSFNFHSFVTGILRYLFSEVFDNARLLGGILILSVIAAMLESVQAAFERQTVSQVAYAVVFLVLMVLAIGSFTEAVGYARHAIQVMSDFMLSALPLLIALLAASGALASAAFFHPLMLFAVHLTSNVVFAIVFPLIFFAAILDLTSALSPRYALTRLAGLFRGISLAVTGVCLSVFVGVSAVQGATEGIVDGAALRSVKFGLKAFAPVVGSHLSDAWETVASASLLVKNAAGIAGLVVVACLALFPALKILAMCLIYSGSAALMQPLGDTPLVNCLGAIGKSMLYVFASVVAVALMFFVAICVLLAAANLAVVMS